MIDNFRQFESKSGKGPKGKDLTTFVRFGNLDHNKKQKGYGSDTFHGPPAPRGFYAFPKIMQEFFLIGSLAEFQPKGQFPKDWKRDDKLTDEENDKIATNIWKRGEKAKSNIRREFKKTTGNIWHHLGEFCKPNEVIDRHGGWVKTDMRVYVKAFNKSSLNDRYGNDAYTNVKSIDKAKGIKGWFSGDHYEVFIDEKI